jgi:hypothetical protein
MIEAVPTELTFIPETAELSMKLVSATGETKIMAIDKNGKTVK